MQQPSKRKKSRKPKFITRVSDKVIEVFVMDSMSPQQMIKTIAPKIPLIFRTVGSHTLGISDTSSKWTLRQELTVKVLRSFLDRAANPPRTISATQRGSVKDPGVKGRMWISRYTIPAEVDGAKDAVYAAADAMKEGGEEFHDIERVPIEVEWTGYRKDVEKNEPEPDIPEDEKYANLMREVTSDVVILYIHGGALYLMDPATHRPLTSQLAKLTGGRVMSVRYRLAPQNPFPSALLDVFVAYLTLLYPPPGAPHTAVPASNIVFAGDSAGGNLSLTLLQLLLQLNRNDATSKVKFQGQERPIPLPAGVAVNSPWCDLTGSMPSFQRFEKFDYLPTDWDQSNVPACEAWPSKPPRTDLYVNGSALCHPLVSPMINTDWRGSPPVFFVTGEEILADDAAVTASRMVKSGVAVEFEQYEAMPHVFVGLFLDLPAGRRCLAGWTGFIKAAVDSQPITTKGTYVLAKSFKEESIDPTTFLSRIGLKDEEINPLLRSRRDKSIEAFNERQANAGPGEAAAPVASKL